MRGLKADPSNLTCCVDCFDVLQIFFDIISECSKLDFKFYRFVSVLFVSGLIRNRPKQFFTNVKKKSDFPCSSEQNWKEAHAKLIFLSLNKQCATNNNLHELLSLLLLTQCTLFPWKSFIKCWYLIVLCVAAFTTGKTKCLLNVF